MVTLYMKIRRHVQQIAYVLIECLPSRASDEFVRRVMLAAQHRPFLQAQIPTLLSTRPSRGRFASRSTATRTVVEKLRHPMIRFDCTYRLQYGRVGRDNVEFVPALVFLHPPTFRRKRCADDLWREKGRGSGGCTPGGPGNAPTHSDKKGGGEMLALCFI